MIWFYMWLMANGAALFSITCWQYEYDSWYGILIYPMLNDWMYARNYCKVLRWIVFVLFTILFLPYLVFHFSVLIVMALIVLLIACIIDLIEHCVSRLRRK